MTNMALCFPGFDGKFPIPPAGGTPRPKAGGGNWSRDGYSLRGIEVFNWGIGGIFILDVLLSAKSSDPQPILYVHGIPKLGWVWEL